MPKLVLLLLMIISSPFPALAGKLPTWFHALHAQPNEVIGYGLSENFQKAKKNALADVAETMKVNISSDFFISQNQDNDGSIHSAFDSKVKTQASAIILGATVLRSELIDGNWYVAVKYDNSPIRQKMANALKGQKLSLRNPNSQFWGNITLVQEIDKALGKTPAYELNHRNGHWYISAGQHSFPLENNDISSLFHNYDKETNLSIFLNKGSYIVGDNFQATIKVTHKGYVSLLYVENDGKTGVIFENKLVQKLLKYPSKEDDVDILIANPEKKALREMYIALWAQKPIDFSQFSSVSATYLDDSSLTFDDLVGILEKHTYASRVARIQP